jgi:very-short-patch-repair endonuclease
VGWILREITVARGLLGAAVVGSVLDLLNVAPGISGKLAPLLLAAVLWALVQYGRQARRMYIRLGRLAQLPPLPLSVEPETPLKRATRYREIPWHGLVLRSQSEVKIAKELDLKGVLFTAAVKLRLKTESHRQTREVDFLIFHDGHWGVLEVDGPQHAHSQKADQWRDARLNEHGILVRRYPAQRCYSEPRAVIDEFLAALSAEERL